MRRSWQGLVPALVIGFGIVAATFVAKHAADWGITVLVAPAVLGTITLIADALAGRRRPSLGAWILAATCIFVSLIVGPEAPRVAESMPLIGTVTWLTLLLPNSRPQPCSPPRS
ncbi:MAG TPA: hypothetical protein VFV19_12405 [Candidatus Polarisedimenticolaceae bacterium]|nr:hypothetical protein [Candidatus Polarisedimenticolaceae bacterium]